MNLNLSVLFVIEIKAPYKSVQKLIAGALLRVQLAVDLTEQWLGREWVTPVTHGSMRPIIRFDHNKDINIPNAVFYFLCNFFPGQYKDLIFFAFCF